MNVQSCSRYRGDWELDNLRSRVQGRHNQGSRGSWGSTTQGLRVHGEAQPSVQGFMNMHLITIGIGVGQLDNLQSTVHDQIFYIKVKVQGGHNQDQGLEMHFALLFFAHVLWNCSQNSMQRNIEVLFSVSHIHGQTQNQVEHKHFVARILKWQIENTQIELWCQVQNQDGKFSSRKHKCVPYPKSF